ncbi:MAG TPA: transcription antitermination factor NusB [Thermoanaerobaculia bacterium]|nr:transcription antitermination factor NusB [Thermoanaerobaculia bacterium]
MNERERSLELLQRIERESLYASILLLGETGFVRTIVLGVLRWRSRLDSAIETLAGRRLSKIDRNVVDVLRIGMYQIGYMNVPPHAAVSETVTLAARHAKRAKGFVNAVMRKAAAGLPEPAGAAARLAHPQWLLDRWTKTYGEERALAIARANQELSYPDALVLSGPPPEGAVPSVLVGDVVRLAGSSADLDRARFHPMDEGSAVIAAIAAATGEEILDLAAAPGGKSIFLRHRGRRVVSNDVSISRLRPLVQRELPVVVSDGRLSPFRRQFETVLLDAPCSATGTIRKNPEIKWRLRESDLATFAALQRDLLRSALSLARDVCVYSTCSLEPEENDVVVQAVLDADGTFVAEDVARYAPAGSRPWVERGVLRLTPDSGADGFTAFVLRRKGR